MYILHSLFLTIFLFIQKFTYYVHSEGKYDFLTFSNLMNNKIN